jgi:hypothetical protein
MKTQLFVPEIFEESDIFKTVISIPTFSPVKDSVDSTKKPDKTENIIETNKNINDGIIRSVNKKIGILIADIISFIYNNSGCNAESFANQIS